MYTHVCVCVCKYTNSTKVQCFLNFASQSVFLVTGKGKIEFVSEARFSTFQHLYFCMCLLK